MGDGEWGQGEVVGVCSTQRSLTPGTEAPLHSLNDAVHHHRQAVLGSLAAALCLCTCPEDRHRAPSPVKSRSGQELDRYGFESRLCYYLAN